MITILTTDYAAVPAPREKLDSEFSEEEKDMWGENHPIVTIPLLPDFGGVTDGTRAKTRADSNNASRSGSTITGGTVVPEMHGCSYKTFMNGKPHSFKGTEGVVGLKRWFEKMEQVFEICKCAEDDKVKFAMCTFEGRALTWWNGNVQTLGLANANQIPWSNVKAMMTTEYCPATEIQRMEQELWTLTLKGDDIEAYSNRFHELVLMCPELVSTESKKIEKYIRGFPERIKGNITSSKPATLHEAINMARELVEQSVQGRAARIGESNKRKWEDNQRNNNNNNHNYNNNHNNNNNRNRNNNHHQQQNRRPETVRAYAAAPAGGKIYAGNLPKCNRCNLHGHQEGDCRTRIPVARDNSLQNVTVGDEEVVVGECVVVTSSSLEMLTNSCLGGIIVSLIFLEGLEEEALVKLMVELFEEDEDGKKNEKDDLFNLKANDQSGKA
ncbi:putative reverse transcriptase domain-containing protein [Tanacetum coccineum]